MMKNWHDQAEPAVYAPGERAAELEAERVRLAAQLAEQCKLKAMAAEAFREGPRTPSCPGAVGAQSGLKFDGGKLPAHLLAPEVYTSPSFFAGRTHEKALSALAQWWKRDATPKLCAPGSIGCVYGLGELPALDSAFSYMMVSLGCALEGERLTPDALPPESPRQDALAFEAICRVLAFGAKKYADRNWELGIAYSRCYGAVFRHVWAVQRGEEFDLETGEHHFAHAACELMFLLAFEARGMGPHFDDRPAVYGPALSASGVQGPVGCGGHAVGAQAPRAPQAGDRVRVMASPDLYDARYVGREGRVLNCNAEAEARYYYDIRFDGDDDYDCIHRDAVLKVLS